MRKTIEFILILAVLIGMLGMIAGLARGEIKPIDPEGTKEPVTNTPDDDSTFRYALSGDWIVEPAPAFAEDLTTVSQAVYFDHKGVSFSDIRIGSDPEGAYTIYASIVGDYPNEPYTLIYNSSFYESSIDKWSGDENLRRFSFGSTPQTVSKEFYELFTSIAEPARTQTNTEPDRTFHQISGAWVLDPDGLYFQDIDWNETVEFKAGGVQMSAIFAVRESYVLTLIGNDATEYDAFEAGWKLDGYNVWDFGETEIQVNNAFYRFLMRNGQRAVALDGVWQFNETIDWRERGQVLSGVDITFGDGTDYADLLLGGAITAGIADGAKDLYTPGNGWTSASERWIMFNKPVYVSESVYEQMLANATRIGTDLTVSGSWEFYGPVEMQSIEVVDFENGVAEKSYNLYFDYAEELYSGIVWTRQTGIAEGYYEVYVHFITSGGERVTVMNSGVWLDHNSVISNGEITFTNSSVDFESFVFLNVCGQPAT